MTCLQKPYIYVCVCVVVVVTWALVICPKYTPLHSGHICSNCSMSMSDFPEMRMSMRSTHTHTHTHTHKIQLFVYNFPLHVVVPSAPISVTANVTGSRNASVSWQEGVLPNTFSPPNLNFEVYLNGSLVNITNSTTVVLNSLSPFTDYKVTVVARNRIGISNISNPTLFMTKDEGKLHHNYTYY